MINISCNWETFKNHFLKNCIWPFSDPITDFFLFRIYLDSMTILQVVKKCNEGARRMQQTEQMCLVVQNLEFKVKVKYIIMARSIKNLID